MKCRSDISALSFWAKCISFIFVCFILYKSSYAEIIAHPEYYIKHYTDEDGLLQNSVESIIIDELDNIWMSTQNGLVKFDGQKFRIYLKKELGTSTDRFVELVKFPYMEGVFALNVTNQLIRVYNGTARLINEDEPMYKKYLEIFDGCKSKNYFGRYGHIWEGNIVKGIFRFDTTRHVIIDENDFNFYERKKFQKAVRFSLPQDEIIEHRQLMSFGDHLYYSHEEYIYNIDTGGVRPVAVYLDGVKTRGSKTVSYKMFKADVGSVRWFISDGENLYKVEKADKKSIRASLVLKDIPLDKYNIAAVIFDENNDTYYLGSITNGMYRITPKRFKVMTNPEKSSNVYYAQLEFKKGYLLVGQGDAFDIHQEKKISLTPDVKTNGWAYLKDRQGNIWTRINRNVYVLDSVNLRVLKVFRFESTLGGLDYDAQEDMIYQGGSEEPFFRKIKAANFSHEEFLNIGELPAFTVLERYDEDRLLLGTREGLYFYYPKTNEKKLIPNTAGMYIRSIYRNYAQDKSFWLAVEGRGVFRFSEKEFVQMPMDKNDYLLFAHAIVDDRLGNFWVSCNKGLFKLKKSDWENYEPQKTHTFYQYYNKSSGFNTNEFNGGGYTGLMLSNGLISFSSMDGVVVFNPENVPEQKFGERLVINRIQNGSNYLKIQDTIIWKNRSENLHIELSIPYFGAAEDVYFVYSVDNNPAMISYDGWIQFNSLSAGRHILNVFVPVGADEDKKVRKRIIIEVPPMWFETWAFYLLVMFLFAGLIYCIYRYRVNRFRHENMRLEIAVRERTNELESTVQTLVESERKLNKELYFQQSLNSNVSHNIKTPLRYLMSSIGRFHQSLLKQDNEKYKEESGNIYSAAQELYKSTEQFVAYMKAVNKLGNPKIERIILKNMTQELVSFFRKFIHAGSIQILNLVDIRYEVDAPTDFLKLILSNFIDNAIKHARAKRIELIAELNEKNELCVIIRDDGIGISPEYIEMLNDYFQQNNPSLKDTYIDIGIGYFTIKEMLPFVGAKIEFSSAVEIGTEIRIVFKKFFLTENKQRVD